MKSYLSTLTITLVCVTSVQCAKCPDIQGVATFDAQRYVGTWYQYQRFFTPFGVDLSCGGANYTLNDDGSIGVYNFGTFPNGTLNDIVGTARFVKNAGPGDLNVVFKDRPDFTGGLVNYRVLATDYDSYALVYTCSITPSENIEYAWLLTRARGQAPDNLSALEADLEAAGVDTSRFLLHDHTDCPDEE